MGAFTFARVNNYFNGLILSVVFLWEHNGEKYLLYSTPPLGESPSNYCRTV